MNALQKELVILAIEQVSLNGGTIDIKGHGDVYLGVTLDGNSRVKITTY